MAWEERAKIFISCGQNTDRGELTIGRQIENTISAMGFETYFAIDQQSPRGLKENIFNELITSEYFLFIDFKREQLDETTCRGSLFTNQELAIASFLDIQLIAFQEEGVKQRDGILGALQANCISFNGRGSLHTIVSERIRAAGWKTNWKNALRLEREPRQHVDIYRVPGPRMSRFFHINVRNLNSYKIAHNCYAYLERATNLSGGRIETRTVEFKWEGYIQPNAPILHNSVRGFDAFFVYHDNPREILFNLFTDSSLFIPIIRGPGDFELSYIVISENFPPARKTFDLHIGNSLNEITLIEHPHT
jgi:hypothetical protein